MSLTLQDKKYIDTSISTSVNELRLEIRSDFQIFRKEFRKEISQDMEKLRQQFQADSNHYMGALIELVRDDIKKISEIAFSKPDREEVREIAQDEIRLHLYRPE